MSEDAVCPSIFLLVRNRLRQVVGALLLRKAIRHESFTPDPSGYERNHTLLACRFYLRHFFPSLAHMVQLEALRKAKSDLCSPLCLHECQ